MHANEIITSKILAALQAGNVAPWQKPWSIDGMRNVVSNKLYRGINVFLLSFYGTDNYFLTYHQAKQLGGSVRKGAKGIPICYYNRKESDKHFDKHGKPKIVSFLKYFTVFNASDCEGLNWTRPVVNKLAFEPIDRAESLLALFASHAQAAPISNIGQRACYVPSLHQI